MCILLFFAAGCTALPAVSVHPHGRGDGLRQTFDRAYVSRSNAVGEDQVVLVNAPLDRRAADTPGRPIEPLPAPPLHTVMAIRLHWRPVTTSLQSEAGLNAVLHWYVYGNPTGGGPPSVLHYVGTGFVRVRPAGDGADVEVSHGTLDLADRLGDLREPLGTFTVDGDFHATAGDARVAEVLAEVRQAMADAAAAYGPVTPTTTPSTNPTGVRR